MAVEDGIDEVVDDEVAVVEDHGECVEVEANVGLELASEDLQSVEHDVGGHEHDEPNAHYQQGGRCSTHSPSVSNMKHFDNKPGDSFAFLWNMAYHRLDHICPEYA